MTAHSGALVLIKVGDGGGPENFTTIGGLRLTSLKLNSQSLNCNTLMSSQWRQTLGGAGMSSVSISGSGIFTDSAAEELLRGYAFANSANHYQFMFANGGMVSGAFQVTEYERGGDVEGQESYMLTLQSAGDVTYTAP